jgi:hypothetical protein
MPNAPGLEPAAILLLAISMFLPGLGITLGFLAPGTISLPARFALAGAFGYAFITLVSLGLAVVHLLTLPAVIAVGSLGTIVLWVIAGRRYGFRRHTDSWKTDVSQNRWRYAAFLIFLIVFGFVRTSYSPLSNFAERTTFRYWADGVEVADAHAIPPTTLQWNHLLEPATSKVAMSSFDAFVSLELGRGPMVPLGTLLFLVSMILALEGFALAESLGLRFLAPMLPLLMFANSTIGHGELTGDLHKNVAEDWGRLSILAAVILSIHALDAIRSRKEGDAPQPDPSDGPIAGADHGTAPGISIPSETPGHRAVLVLAGVMVGVSAGTHLVPTVVGLSLIGAYAVMRMVVDLKPSEVLRIVAGIVLVGVLVGGAVLLIPGGDLGFKGVAGGQSYDAIRTQLGLPSTFDPTEFIATGSVQESEQPFSYGPVAAFRDFAKNLAIQPQSLFHPGEGITLLLIGLALLVLALFGESDLRVLAGTAAIFAALLAAGYVLFAIRYKIYVFELFGSRRLGDYVPVPVFLVGIGVGEVLLRKLAGLVSARSWSARLPSLTALGVVALVTIVLVPRTEAGGLQHYQADYQLLEWVGKNDPCQGRVLSDRRTLGTLESIAHRPGVLEGMGPHLRPSVLELALTQIFAAQTFFVTSHDESFLQQNGVALVVVTTPKHDLGGAQKVGPDDPAVIGALPFLEQGYSSAAGIMYRVRDYSPPTGLPDPSHQPGYECGG